MSAAARGLARGEIAAGVEYGSKDEIGDVAGAFRDVHATAERLVDEIRAENRAVTENRLEHRADVSGLDGVWAQLLGGMNETMASFAELQERREHAERESARTFEMSLDLMCVIGFDGYFKRVNPAFERALGYSRDVLLSHRGFDLTHPDDLERSSEIFSTLSRGEQVEQFENRNVCADGSVRWLEWSARAVAEEGLVYAVARDVTESRRAAEEQAALRRVATLVARGGASSSVLGVVAEEAGRLMSTDIAMIARYGPGPSATGVVGWRRDGKSIPLGSEVKLGGRNVASVVFRSGHPARIDSYGADAAEVTRWVQGIGIRSSVGVPITVEGQLWGVMTVSLERQEALPPDTEDRLAAFTELAATAIANAEARDELKQVADEQSALRRVATLVARGVAPELVFSAVAEEVASLLPAVDLAFVGRYRGDGSIEFVGGWSSVGPADWVGQDGDRRRQQRDDQGLRDGAAGARRSPERRHQRGDGDRAAKWSPIRSRRSDRRGGTPVGSHHRRIATRGGTSGRDRARARRLHRAGGDCDRQHTGSRGAGSFPCSSGYGGRRHPPADSS